MGAIKTAERRSDDLAIKREPSPIEPLNSVPRRHSVSMGNASVVRMMSTRPSTIADLSNRNLAQAVGNAAYARMANHSVRQNQLLKDHSAPMTSRNEVSPARPAPHVDAAIAGAQPIAVKSKSRRSRDKSVGSLGSSARESMEMYFDRFVHSTATAIADDMTELGRKFVEHVCDDRRSYSADVLPFHAFLPGAPATDAKPSQLSPSVELPSVTAIELAPVDQEDRSTVDRVEVPPLPDGDVLNPDAGRGPEFSANGASDVKRMDSAKTVASDIGQVGHHAVVADLVTQNDADRIQPAEVDLRVELRIPLPTATAITHASDEMREYLSQDIPANLRTTADDALAVGLEAVLEEPRKTVSDAAAERDASRERAILLAQGEADRATAQAQDEENRSIVEARESADRSQADGLQQIDSRLSQFDAELDQFHQSALAGIDETVRVGQEKADAAVVDGEAEAKQEKERAERAADNARQHAESQKERRSKKNWLGRIIDFIEEIPQRVLDWLAETVQSIFQTAKAVIHHILQAAQDAAHEIIQALRATVVQMLQETVTGIRALTDALLVDFPALRDSIRAVIDKVVEQAIAAIEEICSRLETTINDIVDRAAAIIDTVVSTFEAIVVTQITLIQALLTGNFADVAKILFLSACKLVGIPGEEFIAVLSNAGNAIMEIFKRPSQFLGNLLAAISQGIGQFIAMFPQRFIAGMSEWLFGKLAEGGIELPKSLSLQSIFMFVLELMGFTYTFIRDRVVLRVGEKAISVIERVMAPITILFQEGPGALWAELKDQAEQIKRSLVEAASEWIVTQVITKAAVRLATMFTPVGAFVQAVMMMYNTIMFFMERIKEIFAWVRSITSSFKSIAIGVVSAAADYIDRSMSQSIPLIVEFLTKLLGIDGIGREIRGVVGKLRAPVEESIDYLIDKLIAGARSLRGGTKRGSKSKSSSSNARIAFKLSNGELHTLWYEERDDGLVLMLASDEKKPFDERLKSASDQAGKQAETVQKKRADLRQSEQNESDVPSHLDALAKSIQEEERREREEASRKCADDEKNFAESTKHPLLLMFAHTRHLVPDKSSGICDPLLRQQSQMNRDAQESASDIGVKGAGIASGLMSALISAGILGPAITAPGIVEPAIQIVGNRLRLAAGALRKAKTGLQSVYVEHPVLITDVGTLLAKVVISTEGNIKRIPGAILGDQSNRNLIIELIFRLKSNLTGKAILGAQLDPAQSSSTEVVFSVKETLKIDSPESECRDLEKPSISKSPETLRKLQTEASRRLGRVRGRFDPLYKNIVVEEGALEADHIHPASKIARMPGFNKLTREEKLHILTLKENIYYLSGTVNASRGNKTYAQWSSSGNRHGLPDNKKELQRLIDLEKELPERIQVEIDRLLAERGVPSE